MSRKFNKSYNLFTHTHTINRIKLLIENSRSCDGLENLILEYCRHSV